MKKKRLVLLIAGAVLILGISGGLFALANGEGTQTDPLITKSYLEEIFQPSVEKLIDEAVAAAAKTENDKLTALAEDYKEQITQLVEKFNAETGSALDDAAYVALLEEAISERLMSVTVTAPTEADVYRTVTLKAGQTLICEEGAEFFLRSGSAASVTALLDVPAGSTLSDGKALGQNVLYVAPEDNCGLKATADASVFLRGDYTVK